MNYNHVSYKRLVIDGQGFDAFSASNPVFFISLASNPTKMRKLFFLTIIAVPFFSFSQLKPVAYTDETQKLNGFVIAPEKKAMNNYGVLILPAWKGIDEHSKEVAQQLSKEGYHAFIADIYGEGNYPKDKKEAQIRRK